MVAVQPLATQVVFHTQLVIGEILKQALDQDPQAKFIKSQLTEYNNFPPSFFFKPPYLSKNTNLFDDPLIETIVDVTKTAKHARDKIFSIRKLPEHQKMAKEVYLRHGSRQNR